VAPCAPPYASFSWDDRLAYATRPPLVVGGFEVTTFLHNFRQTATDRVKTKPKDEKQSDFDYKRQEIRMVDVAQW
jgi:hypothetical protein